MSKSVFTIQRNNYHRLLLDSILSIDNKGIPSNADSSSKLSIEIATGITEILSASTNNKVAGQTSGKKFEEINTIFLENTFLKCQNLRPGDWHIINTSNKSHLNICDFVQYEHLEYLTTLAKNDSTLAASLGNGYMISPDIVIYKMPISDDAINVSTKIVDNDSCKMASLRLENNSKAILHASVSIKWTIRSDRAQNSRTEALNLIRNRKGRVPHIVVVTGEPLPSRLASLALGTGDIDCLYHFALYELIEAVQKTNNEEAIRMLEILVQGKRLKDISDLPLDLCN